MKGGIDLERSKDWLDAAKDDLDHAKHDLEHGFYNWACFSSQQAAEKAVKAVFQRMGAQAWGHSVADLLEELSNHFEIPEELLDFALELDKAYIPTRYPDALPSGSPRNKYSRTEAERLVDYAEKIVRFCEDLLSRI
ncbi:DNA-binding protein [Thermotoga sp. Ku-13t]|uniref:HEPN domain-containing protein n=1 Tax=Thermotoga sp. Ku-13t TaxID=1755813 RepID=UPI0013EBC7FB|nr:DNA-binding protein [Thermotoga sp. Ku-13t]